MPFFTTRMKHLEGIIVALFLMGAFSFGFTLLSRETNTIALMRAKDNAALILNAVTAPEVVKEMSGIAQEVLPEMTEAEISTLKIFLRAYYQTEKINTTPYFDTDTKALLLKYQRDTALPETGLLDTATRKSITDALFRTHCPKGSGDIDASMTPISPTQGISKTYTPDGLIAMSSLYTKNTSFCLTQRTRDAVMALIDGARADGFSIKVSSAFRSYATQAYLYRMHFDILKLTRKTVAVAGHSEHQLGVAVDLTGASIGFKSASAYFKTSPEYTWLIAHAGEYGFVQSYPTGKETITGYAGEPWHFRYVGKEIANEILKEEITVYEYLNKITGEAVSI